MRLLSLAKVSLATVLAACSGCTHVLPAAYQPAIIRDALPPGRGAVTVCAENNVPYVVVDSATMGQLDDEGARVHEMVHVRQILAYRGGCWPFLYRYRVDSAFKAKVELEAYCVWGRWMIEHNRVPAEIWSHITATMLTQYGTVVRNNCLYEDWNP